VRFYRNRDWRAAVPTLYLDQRAVDLHGLLETTERASGLRTLSAQLRGMKELVPC
jgi:hypothetical protein